MEKTLTIEVNYFELLPAITQVLEGHGIFTNLLHDDVSMEDIVENLNSQLLLQVAIDAEFAGFFSLEDLGDVAGRKTVEVHAFILPHMRKYSKLLLEEMRNFIFANTGFHTIATSVPDKFPHVKRTLKMMGFKELLHKEGVVRYCGEETGISFFYCQR